MLYTTEYDFRTEDCIEETNRNWEETETWMIEVMDETTLKKKASKHGSCRGMYIGKNTNWNKDSDVKFYTPQ